MRLLEDEVEQAALTWFKELNYSIAHAPYLAPGEIAAECTSFSDVVLVGRARDAITRLNPTIPSEAREEAIAHACGDSRYAPAEAPD
jgi:type I restriction enzyme, R subunit